MLLVIPLGIFLTNSGLISPTFAQVVDSPYLTTKVGSKILSNGLADFVNSSKTSTGGGTQTTACKIGANSAQVMSALKGQGQKFFEKGYNYGWLAGIVVKVEDLEGTETIIDDLQKSGTNLIIRACYGGPSGCNIASMGAPKDVIVNDAKAYAQATITLAEKSNYPFWIVGGHNEPNLVEIRTPADEALFLKTFTDTLQDPSKYKDKTKFYETRSKINVLAPILADPIKDTLDSSKGIISIDDYISQMEGFSANVFGGVVGYAFNLYSVDSFTKVSNFVEKRKSKAYITETGIFPTATPISVSNKQFNQFRVDYIDQFYTNPNIAAILIFNGMLTDTYKLRANEDDQDEADRLLPSDYPLSKNRLHKLEPSTHCSVKEEDPGCKDKDGWNIYYETQILSALSTGGCSNTFVRSCSYDSDIVETTNKAVGETTAAYFDMLDPVRSGGRFENQAIGQVKIYSRCSIFVPKQLCPEKFRIYDVWDNVLKDGVFTSNIVNTVQVDVPLLKSIASTEINGTDELSFTSYGGSLNRKRYEVKKDFTRKVDATAKIRNIDGSSTQVAIPLLGSANLLYSRDFEDFSSYDRDVVRSPLDFLTETYNNKSSASSRRIEERSTNYGLTSISDFSKKGMLRSIGIDEFSVSPSKVFQPDNVISSSFKPTENNDVSNSQFNSAQVLSGESIVRNTFLDSESDTVKCSDFGSVFGAPLDEPVDSRTTAGYGTCETTETPSGDYYQVTGDGKILGAKITGHYVTIPKECYKVWCADPKKKKPLTTVVPSKPLKKVESSDKSKMFIQTGNSPSEMYFLKKITFQGSNLDSMSALLRIMRTAWEQSNRMNFNSERRVCHKEISTTVNTYTRQYTVSKEQTNIKTGNNDQCSNPNNAAYIGTLRPAIKADDKTKSFVTSSAEIPFLGTVAAINERLSKADYSVSASTPLQECGSEGDNYFACLCKEDTESLYITKEPDPLAVFLCENGMLTLDEIIKAKIDPKICLEGPRNQSTSNRDGGFGQFYGVQDCDNALKNPTIKNAIEKAATIGKVPNGVVMAIWQLESTCAHVNTADPINDTSLLTENNTLCKERGCDVRGPFQIKDDTFSGYIQKAAFNECRASIGVDTGSTPNRSRWGDALCVAAIKLGNDGGNVAPQNWNEANIENAAYRYLGACEDAGVEYCKEVKAKVEYYNSLFK